MSHINFELPQTFDVLLSDTAAHYFVRDLITVKQIPSDLKGKISHLRLESTWILAEQSLSLNTLMNIKLSC